MENNYNIKDYDKLLDPSLPLISNLSNMSALLNTLHNINWCGFYLVKDNVLYLGPFQGDIACSSIPFNKGVCGTAAANKQTIIVPDVNQFPGHIACSPLSKSEIVVPIMKYGVVVGVIDIDSPCFDRFSENDKTLLENIANSIAELF